MNIIKILLAAFCFLIPGKAFAVGLSGNDRYKAEGAKAKDIDSLYFFEPFTWISLMDANNELAACDSCAAVARAQIERTAAHFAGRMKLSAPVRMADTVSGARIRNEIYYAMSKAEADSFVEDIHPLRTIDSVLNGAGLRYGLIILNTGFVRTKAGMKAARKEANRKELASLGFLSFTAVRCRSSVWAMIVDAKEHRTYYYNTCGKNAIDDDPLNFGSVKVQFINLFSHFYWGEISGFDLSKIN